MATRRACIASCRLSSSQGFVHSRGAMDALFLLYHLEFWRLIVSKSEVNSCRTWVDVGVCMCRYLDAATALHKYRSTKNYRVTVRRAFQRQLGKTEQKYHTGTSHPGPPFPKGFPRVGAVATPYQWRGSFPAPRATNTSASSAVGLCSGYA